MDIKKMTTSELESVKGVIEQEIKYREMLEAPLTPNMIFQFKATHGKYNCIVVQVNAGAYQLVTYDPIGRFTFNRMFHETFDEGVVLVKDLINWVNNLERCKIDKYEVTVLEEEIKIQYA